MKNKDSKVIISEQNNNVSTLVYYCFLKLSDGSKLYYGTHRNEHMNYENNIFGGFKKNAYELSKEEAEIVCKDKGCEMEIVS
jgi:hypothetical protein